jgi:membrane-bound ClpP family serine protease
MQTTTLTPVPRRHAARPAGVTGVVLFGVLMLAALTPAPVDAEPDNDRGYVLKVPSALDTRWIEAHKKFILTRLKTFEEQRKDGSARFKVVCDFNPDGRPSACDDFYAADKLADFLLELDSRGVRTIAYVHDETTRHSVLPVLACSQIVFADKPLGPPDKQRYPSLGRVASPDRPLRDKEREAYEKIASGRGRGSPALIRKMYDADLVVVDMGKGVENRFREKKPGAGGDAVPELGGGNIALYTFADADKYEAFQKTARNSLNDVLAAYGLSSGKNLYDAPEQTIAWTVKITGEMTPELRERTERRIRRALDGKTNLLILQLECHGGDSATAQQLAQFILDRNKERGDPVHIVAYVTPDAKDTAAFLMFACHEIVFHEAAILDFEQYVKMRPKLDEGQMRDALVNIADGGVHSPVLAEGMLNRSLLIHSVASRTGDSRNTFLRHADYLKDKEAGDKRQWEWVKTVKPDRKEDQDRYLSLTAEQARKLGLVADDGIVRSWDELCTNRGLDPAEVQLVDDDWLEVLVNFLKHPLTSVVLVMIGITCIILELKMPGVSFPGVLAAICFVLFFWAHCGFSQIGVLAMLLFALGIILVALEIFVLPGFGVPGVTGVLLMFGSVGLAAYGHWPRSGSEWLGYGKALYPFCLSLLGGVVAAYFSAKYLPHVPYVNRLFLKPPSTDPEDGESEPVDPARAEMAALLGAIGVAATPLRPAGKVQIGEQFVDVVAESGYVEPGTRVQVVEIEGIRVVVKEV